MQRADSDQTDLRAVASGDKIPSLNYRAFIAGLVKKNAIVSTFGMGTCGMPNG
jgi:hypothetical protein